MSHWNHRVVKSLLPDGTTEFTIREVFYNDDDTIMAHTLEAVKPYGETIKELRETLQWMLNCLDFPILIDGEVDFVDYLERHEDSNQAAA